MPSAALGEPLSTEQLRPKSKINRILTTVDVFSVIPVPEAYPVSTRKSKAGSLIFIIAITSYLIYDFVKFLTANSPKVNSYQNNIPADKVMDMPQVAFGFVYGSLLNQTLNDPSYFSFAFQQIQTYPINGNTSNIGQNKTYLPLIQNCAPAWMGQYNQMYRNFTCVNSSLVLMNVPSQSPKAITQRLLVTACVNGNSQNVTCQNLTQLYKMTSGGRLFLMINNPAGFDYQSGGVSTDEYNVQIYQFFLVPGLYNRLTIELFPFQYNTFPTYFTSWQQKHYFFLQAYSPVSRMSNVSIYNSQLMIGVTFMLYPALTLVDVQYQTFVNKMSQWGALASTIMAIFGICCLAHNKNKFLQQNPKWKSFDKNFDKHQIQIQMQPVTEKSERSERQNKTQPSVLVTSNEVEQPEDKDKDEDISGISAIRKRIQNKAPK